MAVTGNTMNCLLVLEHDAEAVLGSIRHLLDEKKYSVRQCGASTEQLLAAYKGDSRSVFVANVDCDSTVHFLNQMAQCKACSHLPIICCAATFKKAEFYREQLFQPFAYLPLPCPEVMFECTLESAYNYSAVQVRHSCAVEKYTLIAQNISESVVFLDTSWRIDFANEHLKQLLGCSAPLQGEHIQTFLDAETVARLESVCSKLGENSKQSFQGYVITSEDEMVPVWFAVSEVAGCEKLLCVMTNLEENLQAEAALREAEAKYRTLYQNAAEGMFRIEETGRIIEANAAFNKIFGFEISDWATVPTSYNLSERFVTSTDFIKLMEQVQSVGRQSKFNAQLMRSDGTPIWGEISAQWSVDPKNQTPYVEGILSDVTERRRVELDLQHRATRDCLTGVFSRLSFTEKLHSIFASACYENTRFAVLYLDLNDFKNVNDTYGHHSGDIVIKELVGRIATQIRERDVFGRIGGDEFCIVLEDIRSTKDVDAVVDKVRSVADAPVRINEEHSVSVGLSVGAAIFPEDGDSPEALLQRADKAMYQEKRS